jgi:hypothetical protein
MRGGGLRKKGGLSFYLFLGGIILRVLLDLQGSLEFCSREGSVQGAPVCWGFWARGPGYPYGILELGSCPSWQGGNKVWAELVSALGNNKAAGWTTGSTEKLASGRGKIVLFCYEIIMVKLFYYVMKLLFVDKFICVCTEFIRNY